jgi:osmotically-inducible protein OsmY
MRKLFLLILAATFAVSTSAGAQTITGGTTNGAGHAGHYDQKIEQQATRALNSKDKWKDVTASSEDGIVTLRGTTTLLIDKLDAAKKVRKLASVEGVRNQVVVESNASDQQLQQKLANKLRYDRVGYGNAFNFLALNVKDGVVTVDGAVRDYPARDSAMGIVETTAGVKEAVNNIRVLPTSVLDDDIRLRVARAIYGNGVLSKYGADPQKPIRIIVENGHVTLYGVVDSKFDKQIAGIQANSVPDVFSVDDRLTVSK